METTTATFFDLVRDGLSQVEARMRISPEGHDPRLIAAIDHLLSSGGKRIRPTLVLLTGGMLETDPDHTITLAASVEMLHTATLVHDDLIDGSLVRRGIPTLNAQWSPGATVLTGDYIFARAAYLAAAIGEKALMEIFARTLMTIVNGEISQLFGSTSGDPYKDYFNRIYAKTASLFEVATEGIAILSSCDEEMQTTIKAFGYNIGIAFQIIDDVLDFTSDQEKLGKPVANDLRQGLITLPTLRYLASTPNSGELVKKLKDQNLGEDALEQLIEEIRASNAIEQTLEQAKEYVSTAEAILEKMPANQEREALYELSHYIINRNT